MNQTGSYQKKVNGLLSVIVPVYNVEKYLDKCVESILNQSYRDLDIILVDDGSTDSSGEICDKYAAMDNRIRVIHKNNEGRTKARKDAILVARGDFVTFVDSDDWIDPEMYEVLFRTLTGAGADIITSGFCRNENDEKFTDFAETGIYGDADLEQLCKNIIWDKNSNRANVLLTLCTKIYRRELILRAIENVPLDIYKSEDLAYTYSPFMEAHKVIITDRVFYHYRVNTGSVSNRYRPDEVSLLDYSYHASRRIYSEYGEDVLNSFDHAITWFWYMHICRWIDNTDGNRRKPAMVKTQIGELSATRSFTECAEHILDDICDPREKWVVSTLIEGKSAEVYSVIRRRMCLQHFRAGCVKITRKIIGEKGVDRIRAVLAE